MTAENGALLYDDDGPYLPGHHEVSYDLGTPRQYTARGGWNINCECGVTVGETGDEDFQERWEKHLASVLPPAGCACEYPYLGAQQAGTPIRCERCRLPVLEDGQERLRVLNEKALRDLYGRAEARGDTRHLSPGEGEA